MPSAAIDLVAERARTWRGAFEKWHENPCLERLSMRPDGPLRFDTRSPRYSTTAVDDVDCSHVHLEFGHRLERMLGLDNVARGLAETLQVLHAASAAADPAVFRALWAPRAACPQHPDCAFCQGRTRGVTLHVTLSDPMYCDDDIQTYLRAVRDGLVVRDHRHEDGAACRQLLEAIAAATSIASRYSSTDSAPSPPLALEFTFSHNVYDRYIDEYLLGLEAFVSACRQHNLQATTDLAPWRITRLVPIFDFSDNEDPAKVNRVFTLLAQTGIPLELRVPYCRSKFSPKYEYLIKTWALLLDDPMVRIVAMTTPPWSNPIPVSESLLKRLSGRSTNLQHLTLHLIVEDDVVTSAREVESISRALFSRDSNIQIQSLDLLVEYFDDEHAPIVYSAAKAICDASTRFRSVCWRHNFMSYAVALQMAQAFTCCGVQEMSIQYDEETYAPWEMLIGALQGCRALEVIKNSHISLVKWSREVITDSWPDADTLRLKTLELHLMCDDSETIADLLETILSHVGTKLTTLQVIIKSHEVTLDVRVLKSIVAHCPMLQRLSVSGVDITFISSLVAAYESGICTISSLELYSFPLTTIDPLQEMLCDASCFGTRVIKSIKLGCIVSGEEGSDYVRRILAHNTTLERVQTIGIKWDVSDDEISRLPEAHGCRDLPIRSRLALLSVFRSIRPSQTPAQEVVRPIFDFSIQSTLRLFVSR